MSNTHGRESDGRSADAALSACIPSLTEQERTIDSRCREWAADATRIARGASGLSAEDFGGKVGVSKSRQISFERRDIEDSREPRIQLDKLVRAPFVSLLAICRGLLGTKAVIVETTAAKTTLDDAGRSLTKESSEAVLASLVAARTPSALRNLAREARELAEVAIGVELAAIEEAERLEAMSKSAPLRAVKP
jgi:transcriptional regulator with XRE-family HTH domain